MAERVGRSRVSVTNTLRLLAAPEEVHLALEEGKISEGHARALLGLPTAVDQVAMLKMVIERSMECPSDRRRRPQMDHRRSKTRSFDRSEYRR